MPPLEIFIKNLKEDTLDSLKLWVSKQKGEIDTEPESERREKIVMILGLEG